MVIASKLLWSILCIHVFWFYFFITGTLVRVKSSPARPGHAKARGRNHMAELVITSTTGMAITGFVLLLLGFVGLLHYGAVLVWLALEALLFKIFKQENVFGSAFWLTRLRVIKRAWSLPARIIYLVFLLMSIPAILPPTLWDSISYHLAYAVDWANAGRIYVDEFLRFPYYANNFVLIYALMFVVKAGYLCHFTTWLCGLLSCLGIYTLIEEEATNQSSQWFRFIDNAKNTILPLTLALSPLFLMFVDVGYVDVPIGLFILVPVLCTYLILKGNTANYDIDLIFTSAFCVGMKISLFLCLPLFVCSLFLVLRWQRKRRSRVLVLSVLLILLSAPWYLRNFVLAGDPITPVLNLKFRGRDPIFTQVDYSGLMTALQPQKDVSAALLLPVNLFYQPDSANLSTLFLYLPVATLLLLALKTFRRKVGPGFIYLNIVVIYLIVNWLTLSWLVRYFLHLFPVYLAFVGVSLNIVIGYLRSITANKRTVRYIAQPTLLVLIVMLAYPSPTSEYFKNNLRSNYLDLPKRLTSKEAFLAARLPGYVSTQSIINALDANGMKRKRVLVLHFENLSYYFRERNIESIGDWFGPGRFADLVTAADSSDLGAYLDRFNIGAVLINLAGINWMTDVQYKNFLRQLELHHFSLQPSKEATTAIYLQVN